MSYLNRTTLDEIAVLADEMELNDRIAFTTEDPDELERYKLQPCEYNLIYKNSI